MAEFDREFLIGHGVPEDQAEEVLAAHEAAVSAAVEEMVPKEEVQRKLDEAVAGMVSSEEARKLADEAVAEALPGHEADFEQIRAANAARRERFAAALAEVGAKVYPSAANFLLCDFGRDMGPTIDALRRRGMLVRPCGMFPGLTDGHVRLCVRTDGENERLVAALQ